MIPATNNKNASIVFLLALFLFIPSASFAMPEGGLIGYWKFDEGAGTVATDSSVSSNDGELINEPTWITNGRKDGALEFNNQENYVKIRDNESLRPSQLSVSVWFKLNSLDKDVSILDKHLGYWLRVHKNNLVYFYVWNGSAWKGRDFGSALSADTWYHVVATYNNQKIRVFLNNHELSSSPYTTDSPLSYALQHLYIGSYINAGKNFDGVIDEVRIYNRILNSDEITELYDSVTPLAISNGLPDETLPPGTTEAALFVSTGKDANCKYDTVSGLNYDSMPNLFLSTGGVSHTSTISGLQNGQNYSFYVKCQDAVRNSNTEDYIINFSVSSDVIPPSIPTNLETIAIFSTSQINLRWSASRDNEAVTGYKIYRNGVLIESTPNVTYQDKNLTASADYTYTVSAYDASGNESGQSTIVQQTTHSFYSRPDPPNYFPFGIYFYIGVWRKSYDDHSKFLHDFGVHLDALKEKGINTVIVGEPILNDEISLFQERNMKIIPLKSNMYINKLDMDSPEFENEFENESIKVKKTLEVWKNNKTIAGWYPKEEHRPEEIEAVRQFASVFRENDQFHPIIIEYNNVNTLKAETPLIADIVISGRYPFNNSIIGGYAIPPNACLSSVYFNPGFESVSKILSQKDQIAFWGLFNGSASLGLYDENDPKWQSLLQKYSLEELQTRGWQ